jgi:Flp pilus assembly protein TadD
VFHHIGSSRFGGEPSPAAQETAELLTEQAIEFDAQHEMHKAIAKFREATALIPNSPEAWGNLATALEDDLSNKATGSVQQQDELKRCKAKMKHILDLSSKKEEDYPFIHEDL